MAAAKYAPALLGFELLAQGWLLLVQELMLLVGSLKGAVRALHATGCVHGDLRGCNSRWCCVCCQF